MIMYRERWKEFFIWEDSEMVVQLNMAEVYNSSAQLFIKTSFRFFS